MNKIYYYCLLGTASLLIGCDAEDRDDEIINIADNDMDLEVNDFIWKGLNQYYYWQESVESLADSQINNAAAYDEFLGETVDPSDFFTSLNHPDDRFSWIDEDYVNLENQLAGISASNGMNFLVSRQCDDCNDLSRFCDLCTPRI